MTKVLVADDERDMRTLIRFPLSRRGVTVVEATNGVEVVEAARRELPDLILLDVTMPGLDGYAACRELRADDATRAIPIVFLSARAQAADVEAGLAAGASGYLTKPFQTAELFEIVSRFTGASLDLSGAPR